ncbi:hypothetical protein AA13595_0357 [Gluconacetobacter johannae DSM 13595]|uniref:Uncharacterized protein n=1 Tax=Gluconacetobacter johannae TaxID=112140 RepID=A0A7W4P5U3_9PROT|nr:hypothetical protein [Gluconacetobacter johannae]MBB2175170.1 hypothetical protein [Gluconacetobacter johannae]GBQ80494.1 hypothetical protein AA13595_0357 [Gluconacetobacter johannae DSM 13595]
MTRFHPRTSARPAGMVLVAVTVLALGGAFVPATAAPASPFTGHWAAMGLSPVIVDAPDGRGLVHMTLPDELHVVARHDIVLTRKDPATLQSRDSDPLVTFHLVSANSADLKIKGQKPGQVLDLPLSRDD